MKKIISICFISIASLCLFANEKKNTRFTLQSYLTDSTIANQILSLPLQNYIGKPVDSLLNVLPPSFSSRGIKPLARSRIKGIYQIYGTTDINNSVIEIYIDTFQHHPYPFDKNLPEWDMSRLKKEKIAFIKVIKNDVTCVYGCNNPNYY